MKQGGGPRITPEVMANVRFAKINQEKEPKKPNSYRNSASKTKKNNESDKKNIQQIFINEQQAEQPIKPIK